MASGDEGRRAERATDRQERVNSQVAHGDSGACTGWAVLLLPPRDVHAAGVRCQQAFQGLHSVLRQSMDGRAFCQGPALPQSEVQPLQRQGN